MKNAINITLFLLSMYLTACGNTEHITYKERKTELHNKSGAQIWGETCIRCHNASDPSTFSDVEWDIAALHMQIRANLTPEETRKVIEFLQSAN